MGDWALALRHHAGHFCITAKDKNFGHFISREEDLSDYGQPLIPSTVTIKQGEGSPTMLLIRPPDNDCIIVAGLHFIALQAGARPA